VIRPPRAAKAPPATLYAGSAYDPTTGSGIVAWQRPGGVALQRRGEDTFAAPGQHPALGGGRIAWLEGERAVVADAADGAVRARLAAPGAGVLAVSDELLAWRARGADGIDRIVARTLGPQPGPPLLIAEAAPGDELGRPALNGHAVVFHVAGPAGSRIVAVDGLTGGAETLLRAEPGATLSNPAVEGGRLLYVRATGRQQELRLGLLAPAATIGDTVIAVHPSAGRRDREHERGRHRHRHRHRHRYRDPLPPIAPRGEVQTLWTTALAPDAAYVTRLIARQAEPDTADIMRVALPLAG
jgi:hypothetical protein